MKKRFLTGLLAIIFPIAASASEPGLEDKYFREMGDVLFVSKCHYIFRSTEEIAQPHRHDGNLFFLVVNSDIGTIIRGSNPGFTGLAILNRGDGGWSLDISSITTSIMSRELTEKFEKTDFIMVPSDEFELSKLEDKTELCGIQSNPYEHYELKK